MSNEKQKAKNEPKIKAGSGDAANVSFDPEHGYKTSEQKENIEKQANRAI